MDNQILFSIVSPVYKAESSIDELVKRIVNSVSRITKNFEIILVDDGSPDNCWEKIKENCKKDNKVKGIKLSRNFGQHYAITAGLDNTKGEWVIVMDCDLQDRPEEIINLFTKAREGYDVVLARRFQRQDSFYKRFFSWIFYKILSYLTGTEQDATVANFGIYNKKVITEVCKMRESIRYFPTMVRWVGFKLTKLDVVHSERGDGKTSYGFKRLVNLALDIILAYSDKPIRLTIRLGLLLALSAFLFGVFNIIQYLRGEILVPGFASIMVSIWFFSGVLIATLGVIGLYLGKTFEGVKNRPIYIIDTKINE